MLEFITKYQDRNKFDPETCYIYTLVYQTTTKVIIHGNLFTSSAG